MVSFLQRLGSLSSNNTVFSYQVPAISDDSNDLVDIINDTANLNIAFSLLQSEVIKNGHDSITVAELLYVYIGITSLSAAVCWRLPSRVPTQPGEPDLRV